LNRSTNNRRLLGIGAAVILSLSLPALVGKLEARQFRSARPIATPVQTVPDLPDGARAVANIVPLQREYVEPAVQEVMASWNTDGLGEHLGDGFYDRTRLLDVVDTIVPRDAKIRLQSIQSVQTLQQYIQPDPAREGAEQLVSKVTVTARTQVEFNSPDTGFQRLPGVNEFLLKITHSERDR